MNESKKKPKSQMYIDFLLSATIWYTYATCILNWNEKRKYLTEIEDPIFQYVPRFDASIPVMIMLYISAVLFALNWQVWDTLQTCWTFNILFCTRSVILYLHPFKGHKSMIPLRDILLEKIQGTTTPLRNDLSFSGHVSTIVTLGLLVPHMRWFFWICGILTSICLICSRVHYSADCVIAPFFAFFAYNNSSDMQYLWSTYVPYWCSIIFIILVLLYISRNHS